MHRVHSIDVLKSIRIKVFIIIQKIDKLIKLSTFNNKLYNVIYNCICLYKYSLNILFFIYRIIIIKFDFKQALVYKNLFNLNLFKLGS